MTEVLLMSITIEDIELFFKSYGWECEKVDSTTIVSGFRGTNNLFSFFVKITDDWVFFMLTPFIRKPEFSVKLHEYLLDLNYEMNLAKVGRDRDGDIFLAVEIATSDLDFDHFSEALDILSFYANTYYVQASNLAANPE
jgi:hypothetical protein